MQLTQSPIYPPEVTPAEGRLHRGVLYAPRFVHHFRRRRRSAMTVGQAWHSTRLRMRDYR